MDNDYSALLDTLKPLQHTPGLYAIPVKLIEKTPQGMVFGYVGLTDDQREAAWLLSKAGVLKFDGMAGNLIYLRVRSAV